MTGHSRATFLAHAATTDRIIGTMYDVHRELGYGFSEVVYRRAMALALRQAGATVLEEAPIHVQFRQHLIGEFRADLVVDRCVIVEVKPGPTFRRTPRPSCSTTSKPLGAESG